MEDLLQFLYLMPVGVVKFQADGRVEMMNPVAAACLLSITLPDTLQNIYLALASIAPDLGQQVSSFVAPAGAIIEEQWLRTSAGGQALVLSLVVNKIKDNVYMAVLTDVTKLSEQENKLYLDRRKFFAIFDHIRDYAIYTITLDGLIEEWNPSLQRYAGWLAADVEGQSVSLFIPPDDPDRPRLDVLLAEALRIGSVEAEGWRLRRDGSRLWGNSIITALPDDTGTVCGFVVVSRDLTERKRREDDVKQLATVDPLTGAYNRRHGDALLAAQFSRRKRYGLSFAVLAMDVDHFKAVNDRYGHAAGDAVLRAVVETCRNALRPVDAVVRWGGEEFLVIMPETDSAAAMTTAERLRALIAGTGVGYPGGPNIHITISIGVALPTCDNVGELLSRADEALYAAKQRGRDRVSLAPYAAIQDFAVTESK
jgi:diguanylate cyclase (GGDEF)-like protein/PAS domain S-box-containing protein